jgi:hypothetical protein
VDEKLSHAAHRVVSRGWGEGTDREDFTINL